MIVPLSFTDLDKIPDLQPPDWDNIIPVLKFYCSSQFCNPIKIVENGIITGIGTSILHHDTAWLAHIIVHPDHRNKGLGKTITSALVNDLDRKKFRTILLIATPLGEFVYRKLGFEYITEYIFFRDGRCDPPDLFVISEFDEKYRVQLFELDRQISGEIRRELLSPHLAPAKLIVSNSKLEGFYFPTLGEGLIMAKNEEAGLKLLQLKLSSTSKIALPADNKKGVEFLLQNNCKEFKRAVRMHLGDKLSWQPENLYSRIGGNLG
jgi:GNAT superfamily N-acetyltransferase